MTNGILMQDGTELPNADVVQNMGTIMIGWVTNLSLAEIAAKFADHTVTGRIEEIRSGAVVRSFDDYTELLRVEYIPEMGRKRVRLAKGV